MESNLSSIIALVDALEFTVLEDDRHQSVPVCLDDTLDEFGPFLSGNVGCEMLFRHHKASSGVVFQLIL